MYKLVLVILLSLGTALMGNGIQWEKDFKSGIESAKEANKPVLFVSSRHSCKYCVILEETTFASKNVISKLNDDFISIITYSDDNDYMPRELWRPGTPAIWFLHPDGTPIFQPLMGAMDEENFLKALHIVKEEFNKSFQK